MSPARWEPPPRLPMVDQGEHWFDPRSVCCFSHLFRLFCATVGSLGPQDSHGSWVPCSIATGQQVRVQGREEWPSSRLPLQLLLRGGGVSGPLTHPGTRLTIRPARFWLSAHPATGRNHQGQVHTTGPFPPPSHFSISGSGLCSALTHLFLPCYP